MTRDQFENRIDHRPLRALVIIQAWPSRKMGSQSLGFYRALREMPQEVAEMESACVAQAKENFEKMNAAAGEATSPMKDTYSATFKGVQDYNTKVLEFAHANINAAFEHARNIEIYQFRSRAA